MAPEYPAARYRKWYAKLLRLYPLRFRERFGEGMAQTFNDMCRERQDEGSGMFVIAVRTFAETLVGIARERRSMIFDRDLNIIRIAAVTALILMVPLVAMQFTDEVVWDLADFAAGGALLFGAGLAYQLGARKGGNTVYRDAFGLAIGAGLLLTWMNLAVGLIGSEDNPANLLFIGVVAVGVIGAVMARFQARGMARALFATALAQVLVPVVAWKVWPLQVPIGETDEKMVLVYGLNAFLAILFLSAGLLFRRAGAADPTKS